MGVARHLRVPGRAASGPSVVAGRSGDARTCARDQRRDARRVPGAAQPNEHERAALVSRRRDDARGRKRNRAHRRDLERVPAALRRSIPVWRVHHCRCDVCAGSDAVRNVRGCLVRPGAPVCRYSARASRDARMVCGSARRDRGAAPIRARAPRAVKIYTVGGALRDELLGLPVADRDYVVVGATPEQMIALGYKPVGKDFPVFLHPQTHEEYALARTERKTARGYHGFAFHAAADVTLEQDLARRDLTINAIAKDEQGTLSDPFNGARDLKAGVLRHVSSAFAEDPVRILRVARFAARFGFTVADETLKLMRDMVASGEADALVA